MDPETEKKILEIIEEGFADSISLETKELIFTLVESRR